MPIIKRKDQISPEKIEEFAKWLFHIRNAQGLNQTEMAEKLGFSVSYYNALEHARRNLSAKSMVQLARALKGENFILQLLGIETVDRYINERSFIEEETKLHMEQDQLLLLVQKDSGLENSFRKLQASLYESNDVYAVPGSHSLGWFGYTLENHFAIISPVTNPFELTDKQLVYYVHRTSGEKRFMFTDFRDPNSPKIITPEWFVIEVLHIPRDTSTFQEWGIDSQEAFFSLSILDPEIVLCEVITLCEQNPDKFRPFMAPFQPFLSLYNRKHMILNGVWAINQEVNIK